MFGRICSFDCSGPRVVACMWKVCRAYIEFIDQVWNHGPLVVAGNLWLRKSLEVQLGMRALRAQSTKSFPKRQLRVFPTHFVHYLQCLASFPEARIMDITYVWLHYQYMPVKVTFVLSYTSRT